MGLSFYDLVVTNSKELPGKTPPRLVELMPFRELSAFLLTYLPRVIFISFYVSIYLIFLTFRHPNVHTLDNFSRSDPSLSEHAHSLLSKNAKKVMPLAEQIHTLTSQKHLHNMNLMQTQYSSCYSLTAVLLL